MIAALTGTIFSKDKNPIILMVGGVGYAVHVPLGVVQKLHDSENITLYTHTHVREDALELYGFRSGEDLTLFELLLSVSGVGPKTALLVIDRGVPGISRAITESDVDFFTTIPRLGKKNAQKIIIELKSKLGSIKDLDLKDEVTSETKDVLDALLSMGFAKKEAIAAIRELTGDEKTMQQKIRKSLQYLGK